MGWRVRPGGRRAHPEHHPQGLTRLIGTEDRRGKPFRRSACCTTCCRTARHRSCHRVCSHRHRRPIGPDRPARTSLACAAPTAAFRVPASAAAFATALAAAAAAAAALAPRRRARVTQRRGLSAPGRGHFGCSVALRHPAHTQRRPALALVGAARGQRAPADPASCPWQAVRLPAPLRLLGRMRGINAFRPSSRPSYTILHRCEEAATRRRGPSSQSLRSEVSTLPK
eukprot:scaffold7502_cov112-Isochrysis_galbana.AAC.6